MQIDFAEDYTVLAENIQRKLQHISILRVRFTYPTGSYSGISSVAMDHSGVEINDVFHYLQRKDEVINDMTKLVSLAKGIKDNNLAINSLIAAEKARLPNNLLRQVNVSRIISINIKTINQAFAIQREGHNELKNYIKKLVENPSPPLSPSD